MIGEGAEERAALLIVTSERKFYLNMLVRSLQLHPPALIDHVLLIDTSTVPRRWRGEPFLKSISPVYEAISLPGVSFHEVLRTAWTYLAEVVGSTHVLMFEEDFILLKRLPVRCLMNMANEAGTLQVVLPRQRWFEAEFSYPNRAAYLRGRGEFRRSMNGDVILEYFTSNPHMMRLDRILTLARDIESSDDYNWKLEYGRAAKASGVGSLQLGAGDPWVWHVGAATSRGVRSAVGSRWRSVSATYAKAHAKRAFVVAMRLGRGLLTRWMR